MNIFLRIAALVIIVYIIFGVFGVASAVVASSVEHQFDNVRSVDEDQLDIIVKFEADYSIRKATEQKVISSFNVAQISEWVAGFDEDILDDVELEIPQKPYFSEKDIAILERVTMSEASTQDFEVQVAVAQTVINRLHMGKFGSSIEEIVYSPRQYSTADNGDPTDRVIRAVQEAINNMPYPSDMVYFRENYYHKWAKNYKKLGVLYFSLEP